MWKGFWKLFCTGLTSGFGQGWLEFGVGGYQRLLWEDRLKKNIFVFLLTLLCDPLGQSLPAPSLLRMWSLPQDSSCQFLGLLSCSGEELRRCVRFCPIWCSLLYPTLSLIPNLMEFNGHKCQLLGLFFLRVLGVKFWPEKSPAIVAAEGGDQKWFMGPGTHPFHSSWLPL